MANFKTQFQYIKMIYIILIVTGQMPIKKQLRSQSATDWFVQALESFTKAKISNMCQGLELFKRYNIFS